ncbi:DEAD/DEAH box helicase [Sporosarcina sp. P13]|uniref:DEAD/DEAH box helicase n=1 Tax=Sporosarcina sp. P13 TaxID=2048263 RepID=UPI00117AC614|nr:hypothetical protein [Sporosarcina sp. P13]
MTVLATGLGKTYLAAFFAESYKRVLDYFEPEFLLGLTATPDRLDNKDVYSLCDGNEAISIHFLDAIRQNWLSPFIYYGVLDETDYSQLQWRNNRYDEEELLRLQERESYADAVLHAWIKQKQTRTIGFCSSIRRYPPLRSPYRIANCLHLANRKRVADCRWEIALRHY